MRAAGRVVPTMTGVPYEVLHQHSMSFDSGLLSEGARWRWESKGWMFDVASERPVRAFESACAHGAGVRSVGGCDGTEAAVRCNAAGVPVQDWLGPDRPALSEETADVRSGRSCRRDLLCREGVRPAGRRLAQSPDRSTAAPAVRR